MNAAETAFRPAWGHAFHLIDMGLTPLVVSSETEAQRANVLQAINRYIWSYDERQLDAIDHSFTEQATWKCYFANSGLAVSLEGRAEISAWLTNQMEQRVDQRRHYLHNYVFTELAEESVTVIASVLLYSAGLDESRQSGTGFYSFTLVPHVSIPGAWAISDLVVGYDNPLAA